MKPRSKDATKNVISEKTLQKAAARLIPQGTLVSTEIQYIQRLLSGNATQDEIDEKVIEVRRLPWASIVQPEL